jgi:hypothetical protein
MGELAAAVWVARAHNDEAAARQVRDSGQGIGRALVVGKEDERR